MGIEDIDDGWCLAGLPPKWWERWVPVWVWSVLATWSNGKRVTRLCDYEACPDADVHRGIYNSLDIWLDSDRINREEKIALMHVIREALKLPDIRNRPKKLPYVGD